MLTRVVWFQSAWLPYWRRRVCKNSLDHVFLKFFPHESDDLDKSLVSVFVSEPMDVIRAHFQTLTSYCAGDVRACAKIFSALYPEFRQRFPSRATHMGMLLMASVYLPVTANWRRFFQKCDSDASAVNDVSARAVVGAARSLLQQLEPDNR